eukprot:c3541_g1_i1 orf=26-514(+)
MLSGLSFSSAMATTPALVKIPVIPAPHVQRSIVRPACSTPPHKLYLSNLDDFITYRLFIKIFFVCKPNDDFDYEQSSQEFKRVLARFLVPFYPLAGRIKETSDGKFEVDCNDLGALVLEGYSDDTLEEVKDPHAAKAFCKRFVYDWRGPITESPLLVFQVCG